MTRPFSLVDVSEFGTVFDTDTGEVILDRTRTKLVRAYTKSVERCVGFGAPQSSFKLVANKDGKVITAFGPVTFTSVDVAFPGCSSAEQIREAHEALNDAGATRGTSPAGRALDYAIRKTKTLPQWRASKRMLDTFSSALYGGIQFGGERKPEAKAGRVCMDIISCYPHLATFPLPKVSGAIVERGLRPNAVLVKISGVQFDNALFSRSGVHGKAMYSERLSGWYVKQELDYHVEMGRVRVDKVIASCTFSGGDRYLARTIEHLFSHREKYGRATPQRYAIKSALNGLLGKFAAPVSPWRTPTKIEMRQAKIDRRRTLLEFGRSALIEDHSMRGIYARHSNVIWTAVTYSRARVKLWQKIDEITRLGGKLLWAHTDCIIADVPDSRTLRYGSALGDWRVVDE